MQFEVNVLIVDDEKEIRELIVDGISERARRVYEASNGQDALALIEQNDIDIIFSDVRMPEMGGIELLKELRDRGYDTVFVLVTAFSDKAVATSALQLGAYDIIEKPFKMEELVATFDRANVKAAYESENKRLVEEFIASKVGERGIEEISEEELHRMRAISKSLLEIKRLRYKRKKD